MRKCIMSFLLVMAILSGNAQTYIGGGMNFAISGNSALDNVIDEYNSSRTWLTTPMKHIGWMRGGHARIGYISDKGGAFELQWSGLHKTVYAEGIEAATGNMVRRDIKMKNNMLSVGGGYVYPNGIIRPGILVFLDLGNIKTYTRKGTMAEIANLDLARAQKTLQAGLTIAGELMIRFGRKSPVALSVRPYFQVQLIQADYFDFNIGVNPNTWTNVDVEDLNSANSHFGLQGALVFLIGDKESKKSNYSYTPEPAPKPKPSPNRGDMKRGNGGGR